MHSLGTQFLQQRLPEQQASIKAQLPHLQYNSQGLRIPDDIANHRHELRRIVGQGQVGLRPRHGDEQKSSSSCLARLSLFLKKFTRYINKLIKFFNKTHKASE